MQHLFLLSGENLDLARDEILALTNSGNFTLTGNMLTLDLQKEFNFDRLAFTKKVYRILFQSNMKNLENNMEKFNWQRNYKKNYSVRVRFKGSFEEKDLASIIWYKLEEPKVNLKNPMTKFEFLLLENKILACLLVHESKHYFESRKAHLRPGFHPSSLHPKLARALVNLTGIKKGIILDPFVGTGGILIEAGLLGFKTVGYDIDNKILKQAKRNLDHFKIKDYELEKKDALHMNEKIDYVATDLPYGKSTWKHENLYQNFLKTLKKILIKKAVVVFPDSDAGKLIEKSGLTIEKEFNYYIHKSLTKRIFVLA